MIVCVTDHCNLAFSNKCTFVGKKKKKRKHAWSVFVESYEPFGDFNCVLQYSETVKGQQLEVTVSCCWRTTWRHTLPIPCYMLPFLFFQEERERIRSKDLATNSYTLIHHSLSHDRYLNPKPRQTLHSTWVPFFNLKSASSVCQTPTGPCSSSVSTHRVKAGRTSRVPVEDFSMADAKLLLAVHRENASAGVSGPTSQIFFWSLFAMTGSLS